LGGGPLPGGGDQVFRGKPAARRFRGLGNMPVLAEGAAEVAPGETGGKNLRTGPEVVEGLFFDGVYSQGRYIAVPGDMPPAPRVTPDPAGPPFPVGNTAAPGAEIAAEGAAARIRGKKPAPPLRPGKTRRAVPGAFHPAPALALCCASRIKPPKIAD
jgi:hypothetical protein